MFTIRFLAFGVCIALMTNGVNAAIIIEQWNMVTGVRNSSGQQFAFAETVQNPFFTTHDIVRGASSARTNFDFTWNDSAGDFLVEVSQRAADVDPYSLRTVFDGRLRVSADQDLLIMAEGFFAYSLPAWGMTAVFSFNVWEDDPPYDAPLVFGDAYSTDGNPPPASGIISGTPQAILPAGHTWTIQYLIYLHTHGSTDTAATGYGYLHFTVQEVPEPTTLIPLGLATLMIRRSQRHRCRSHVCVTREKD